MNIDEVETRLLQGLFHDGWALKLEDDISEDFKSFSAFKKDGPLNTFTRLDVVLFTLDNDPEDVAIRFLFQPDQERAGQDTWSAEANVQESDYEAFRFTCDYLLNMSGMNTENPRVTVGTRPWNTMGGSMEHPAPSLLLAP